MSGEKKLMMPKLIRDLDETNACWGTCQSEVRATGTDARLVHNGKYS